MTRRALWAVASAALVALAAVSAVLLLDDSDPVTIRGSVHVEDRVAAESGCRESQAFPDVREGATVSVLSLDREPLAEAALGPGRPTAEGCVFPFTLPPVEGGQDYRIRTPYADGVLFSLHAVQSGPVDIHLAP